MVMKFLSDNEVITVAMNLEDEGYKFYNEAAKISKHKQTRDIFARLRDEEKEHYNTFKELLAALPKEDSRDYFDIKDETAAYLNSLIETGVFKGLSKHSAKKMTEIETLEMGVKAERDSILFYTQACQMSANAKGKEMLSKLMDVEKEHLMTLANRLRVAYKLF